MIDYKLLPPQLRPIIDPETLAQEVCLWRIVPSDQTEVQDEWESVKIGIESSSRLSENDLKRLVKAKFPGWEFSHEIRQSEAIEWEEF